MAGFSSLPCLINLDGTWLFLYGSGLADWSCWSWNAAKCSAIPQYLRAFNVFLVSHCEWLRNPAPVESGGLFIPWFYGVSIILAFLCTISQPSTVWGWVLRWVLYANHGFCHGFFYVFYGKKELSPSRFSLETGWTGWSRAAAPSKYLQSIYYIFISTYCVCVLLIGYTSDILIYITCWYIYIYIDR